MMITQRYEVVDAWCEENSLNIANAGKIFFPFNVRDTHWVLIVAYLQENKKRLTVYDSLKTSTQNNKTKYSQIIKWIEHEFIRKGLETSGKFKTDVALRTPKQQNDYDCGVFLMVTVNYLLDDLRLDFAQWDIEEWRYKIALHLLTWELKYYNMEHDKHI
jgi:sentrin-specific protease 1